MSSLSTLSAHGLVGGGKAKGDALPEHVLSGKTFSGSEVNPATSGTMPDRGAPSLVAPSSIPPGYYSGGETVPPVTSWNSQTFNASGSFTVPSGVTEVLIISRGGGGGGGKGFPTTTTYSGGGGGSGGYARSKVSVTPGEVFSVSVGAGGAGALENGNYGGNGGNSTAKGVTGYGGKGPSSLYGNSAGAGGGTSHPASNEGSEAGMIGGSSASSNNYESWQGGHGGGYGRGIGQTDYHIDAEPGDPNTGAGGGGGSTGSGEVGRDGGSGFVTIGWWE